MQMTGKSAQRARDELVHALRKRILVLTLSLIPQPPDSREISLTIRDLEGLLKALLPVAQRVADLHPEICTAPRRRGLA